MDSTATSPPVDCQVHVLRKMEWGPAHAGDPEALVRREWLVTNGLGGYASGTIAGLPTRRYHGLLIAALPAPLGRMLMLNQLTEELRLPGGQVQSLDGSVDPGGRHDLAGPSHLDEFRLEMGLPLWVYSFGAFRLEKRILMPYLQNTVYVHYRLIDGPDPIRLRIRPSIHFRPHEGAVSSELQRYVVSSTGDGTEIAAAGLPPLRVRWLAAGGALVLDAQRVRQAFYTLEQQRGYDSKGPLWSPGYFRADVQPGGEVTLVASTEAWDTLSAIAPREAFAAERQRRHRLLCAAPPEARTGTPAQLVLAADQVLMTPNSRPADAARAAAAGDAVRSVIAGYHWFTDWGRDTMISLEGLTLVTGRHVEAAYILRTFAYHVRDGLIPNLFPEGEREGLYHTADATLWYFHAVDRYVQTTGDRETLAQLLPILHDIMEHHFRGTRFGIHVDPTDGLLAQGQKGYQLTWMDAKVGDWVVTPRRGKAVEINALFYNALRLMENWTRETGDDRADRYRQAAQRVEQSFNERFWYPEGGYLYDVLDGENGNDASMRPNQLFAISLPHAVLDRRNWGTVLQKVTERLLTPMGLRSLAPGEREYKPNYDGDLRARDAAYHQGTVWAWLIGPFIDAWLRVHPEDVATAHQFLLGFEDHLGEACIGSISEIFDAEAPYQPRGCVAQAWSVAEVLRTWMKTLKA